MKSKELNTNPKRRILRKSVTSILMINMLCLSVIPALTLAEGQAIAAPSKTAAKTNQGPTDKLGLNVRSAILMEPTTGQVLYSVNGDDPMPPASMTKMMTEYIVAEQVKQGKLKWDQVVTVQENASKQIGSRVFLAQGDQHTVEELYIAMAIASANDATVALAELVGGTEQNFVKMMNEEAKRMGMKTAYFANSTGLNVGDMPEGFRPSDPKETVMSAKDAATLAKYIVTDHPDFTRFTTLQSYKFRSRDKTPLINLDWMLEANKSNVNFRQYAYPGLDGLKTGHTENAGNCFTGTAVRNGVRLISVVMGTDAKSQKSRFVETKKLLDYGFDNFEIKQVAAPKTTIKGAETVSVKKATETEVPVVTDKAVSFVVKKGSDLKGVTSTVKWLDKDQLTAPLPKGTKVGTITYTYKADDTAAPAQETVNLITAEETEKAGWFKLLLRAIGQFFVDLFNSIKNLF
ncbi:D-alanyl-D-alanine carboxypeptidase family protein [Paenibacillus tuaregi]|uniref:D-alanyl-D-alanine carboxypeptidase family protein n=1 Tax=Paenibacillus tuaregi TaxID=1816681 RepID=UPI0008392567|nr:D-alanyl-D-alanine carboxypeptidase family protein [Paenibacillus tuaregi]